MSRQTAIWALAALLGIALTAAITWGTSQLTSQRIGISSEPLSAASSLAPRQVERHSVRRAAKARHTGAQTQTTPAPSTPVTPTPAPAGPPVSEPAVPETPSEPERATGGGGAHGGESSADDGGGGGGGSGKEGSSHARDD